ncbi:hypothetical protein DNTS_031296 [Danionella cerebrum]|uniref:Uncharacterized protein n=1 Tax=Danionella cerebrum TaxID=2873325 RepID=A0A553Q5X9_9TELE|nr:hypothetical protein DNTS_031296 [Danionella translucida]TRY85346.1 hypothetical protein DNTS_031296 [Danionella translucida]
MLVLVFVSRASDLNSARRLISSSCRLSFEHGRLAVEFQCLGLNDEECLRRRSREKSTDGAGPQSPSHAGTPDGLEEGFLLLFTPVVWLLINFVGQCSDRSKAKKSVGSCSHVTIKSM